MYAHMICMMRCLYTYNSITYMYKLYTYVCISLYGISLQVSVYSGLLSVCSLHSLRRDERAGSRDARSEAFKNVSSGDTTFS